MSVSGAVRTGYAPSGGRTAAESVAVARAAEAAGLDELWLSEDYFERGAFAVAGAIAAATERIAIGIGVVNPWTRHPVLTAMEFAAVDHGSIGARPAPQGTRGPVQAAA